MPFEVDSGGFMQRGSPSRAQNALHGLSESLSQALSALLGEHLQQKRAAATNQDAMLRQMLQDFQTQANSITTPENVQKFGSDVVGTQLANLKRRLPQALQPLVANYSPDLGGLMGDETARLAPLGKEITSANKPEDVPTAQTLQRRSLEQHVNPLPSASTYGIGADGSVLPDQRHQLALQTPEGQPFMDPAVQSLIAEANARRKDLEASEPRTPVTDFSGGAPMTQFLSNEQLGGLTKPVQTGFSIGQEGEKAKTVATGTAQGTADVENNPVNQAGKARGAGMVAGAQESARLAAQMRAEGMTEQQISAGGQLATAYEQASKPYFTARGAMQNIAKLAKDGTPQSDMGLIYSIMHMYDPNSVVREGEFSTAAGAAGILGKLQQKFNQLQSGDKLTPEERNGFVKTARIYFNQLAQNHQEDVDTFKQRAAQARVPEKYVIRDYTSAVEPPSDKNQPGAGGAAPKVGEQRQF